MIRSKYVLFLALILSTFGAAAGSPLRAASSEWDHLTILKRGQQIRAVLNDARLYQGEFQALNDEGITLRQSASEHTIARKDILRVYVYYGARRHLMRNMVIGAGIGALLTIPVFLANNRNGWWNSAAWAPELFIPAGAGVGAFFTNARWHEVYRSPALRVDVGVAFR